MDHFGPFTGSAVWPKAGVAISTRIWLGTHFQAKERFGGQIVLESQNGSRLLFRYPADPKCRP